MIPGEYLAAEGNISANHNRMTRHLSVVNLGDRPIQVGSHFHFYETNAALSFDREQSKGFRLNIPSGNAVRFEPGERTAYHTMKTELNNAWTDRQANLPYTNPYELLIMASLIEKETAHEDDRRDVAAVFRNRLQKNMRLQTDPAVIYGMGSAYRGKIHRSDLQRDTPYNTYTRSGLPPTPIALPSKAALEAAANPSDSNYLYFVSKMDDTGRSQFSSTLDEHNDAVKKYILKKGK